MQFYYKNSAKVTVKGKTYVGIEVEHIDRIVSSFLDKNDKIISYLDYTGLVMMPIEVIKDKGFDFSIQEQPKGKKIRTELPKQGGYSGDNLDFDIDRDGVVWLVEKTLYEIELHQKLKRLNSKMTSIKKQIQDVLYLLEELDHADDYEAMGKQMKREQDEKYDAYDYGNRMMQNELSDQEINKMNGETNGFYGFE